MLVLNPFELAQLSARWSGAIGRIDRKQRPSPSSLYTTYFGEMHVKALVPLVYSYRNSLQLH